MVIVTSRSNAGVPRVKDDPGSHDDEPASRRVGGRLLPRPSDPGHLGWAVGNGMAFFDHVLTGVAVDGERAHLQPQRGRVGERGRSGDERASRVHP